MLRPVSSSSSTSGDPLAELAAAAHGGSAAAARRFVLAIGPVVVGIVRRIHAVPSPSGARVVFQSNWGTADPAGDDAHVFIADFREQCDW